MYNGRQIIAILYKLCQDKKVQWLYRARIGDYLAIGHYADNERKKVSDSTSFCFYFLAIYLENTFMKHSKLTQID